MSLHNQKTIQMSHQHHASKRKRGDYDDNDDDSSFSYDENVPDNSNHYVDLQYHC